MSSFINENDEQRRRRRQKFEEEDKELRRMMDSLRKTEEDYQEEANRAARAEQEKQNAIRFPIWQFKNGKVLDGIEAVLDKLKEGSLDDFGQRP